jgi:hypothetical protein
MNGVNNFCRTEVLSDMIVINPVKMALIIQGEKMHLESQILQCPYCWENFEWINDPSDESEEMIEDCFVCCHPIHLKKVQTGSGESEWVALHEDEY